MMQIRPIRLGPIALTTTTTTNLINPPALTGGTGLAHAPGNTFIQLRHICITNRTNQTLSLGLWLGATGANANGTEFEFAGVASAGALTTGFSILPFSFIDRWMDTRLDAADFIVGGASAAGLVLTGDGYIGVTT